MPDTNVFQRRRRMKQFAGSLFFLGILILGWRFPLLGYFIPFCMLLGLGLGIFSGRKWCDWYCPRGSFYDSLASRISPKRKIPDALRSLNLRLIVLAFLMTIMAVNLILRWPDINRIGAFFVLLLTITTAIGIILAAIFHQRAWCLICPIGTLVNLIGGQRKALEINSSLCTECKLCEKACPIQLRPYKYKSQGIRKVAERDCLKCGSCIMVCPKKALKK